MSIDLGLTLSMRHWFYFILWALWASCAALTEVYAQRPQLVIQTGHVDEVRAVAFSPDNKILASGSVDNTVRLWDVATGIELSTLPGHVGGVYSVAFSPDGSILATAGADQAIRLWDVGSGKELRSLTKQPGVLVSVVFSPDGKNLASASLDRTIDLWDVTTGQQLRTLRGHSSEVLSVAFSPDGKILASGGNDQTVKIWDVATGKEIRTLNGHTGEVYSVSFSPDGKMLGSGSADQTIVVWDVNSGRELRRLRGHTGLVRSVVFSPDGKTLVSGSTDDTIRLWQVSNGTEILKLVGDSRIATIALSSDGMAVASGNRDRTITLWDLPSRSVLRTLKGQSTVVNSIAFSPDNRMLAIGNRNATIKLLSTVSGTELRTLEERSGTILSVAFSPDGRVLASGNSDQTVKLWDTTSGKLTRTLADHSGPIRSVAFSPDGKTLASGSVDRTVKLWDVSSGIELRTLKGHSASVLSVAFSPDGKSVVSGGDDTTIKLWDVASGAELRRFLGHSARVYTVAFSPDGKTLASGSSDSIVKLWDVSSGTELRTLKGHSSVVTSVAFSPDGKTVVSGSLDKTARLWDVLEGIELRRLTGNRGAVYTVALSSDGRVLATGGLDAVTKLWDMSTGEELLSLLSGDPGNWLVATPDSLFDGSAASWNQIHWSFGKSLLDVAPVEAFFNDFYYPGLLADILSGKHPQAPQQLSRRDIRPPQLKLIMDSPIGRPLNARTIKINIEVTDGSVRPTYASQPDHAGAQDVRLFRNGSLIKLWSGDVLKGQPSATLQASVPIGPGENRFTAYAFNHDNIKSSDASLVVTGDSSLKRTGTFYVLAVGINEYSNPEYNLRYSAGDAQSIAEELKKQQQRLGIYSPVKIIPLLDREATKANILLALKRFAGAEKDLPSGTPTILNEIRPAQIEDSLIVFFSGHGTASGNRFYYIPSDLGYDGSRTMLSMEALQLILAHSISDIELEEAFEQINAGHLLLVLDAANSGQALEAEDRRRGPMNSKGLAQLAYEKGMYILTASQSFQAAIESSRFEHGLLTFALLEGLTTSRADKDRDGQVTALEWLDYATERVPILQVESLREREKRHHPSAPGLYVNKAQEIDPEKRQLQRPRVFYRREVEAQPLVVARP